MKHIKTRNMLQFPPSLVTLQTKAKSVTDFKKLVFLFPFSFILASLHLISGGDLLGSLYIHE